MKLSVPAMDTGPVARTSLRLATAETVEPIWTAEELCKAEDRGNDTEMCMQLMLDRLVVATGFSSNHYTEAQSMIGSVQVMMPKAKLLVYDLGMTSHQRDAVSRMCGVELRTFNFTKYPKHVHTLTKYAWKPLIVHELSKRFELVVWGDASVRILKPLQEYILQFLLDVPVPFVGTRNYMITVQMTHSGTLKYLNVTRQSMRGLSTIQGGAWILWLTDQTKRLLDSWVDCALHEECIAPSGAELCSCGNRPFHARREVSYCGCHRFDQSALNAILVREFGKKVFETAANHGSTFGVDRSNNLFTFSVKYCA